MKREIPKKIAIIGLPGSGKSTFALKLGKVLNIPVHHLDKHMFDGKKKRDKAEFLKIKESLLQTEAWIIEGCSFSTLEKRFAHADTVIYFRFSRMLCLWRIFKRPFISKHRVPDTGCLNGVNWTLIMYLWNFDKDKHTGIESLRKKYPKVEFLIFRHPHDIDKYLERLHTNRKYDESR